MNLLSPDSNIFDLFLWRKNKSSKSSLKTTSDLQLQSQASYYQALSFEQIITEANQISQELDRGLCNLKILKEALILLTEIENRLQEDNASLSLQVKGLISDLDRKIFNLKI